MIVHQNINHFKAINPVVTIGTFDGVHRGHRKVIAQLNSLAAKAGGQSVIFTFYPHPRLVVSKQEHNLRLLTTLDEKIELLGKSGIDHLVIFPFTPQFAALTYREFMQDILLEKLGLHTLVVGHDHRFGKNREGTFENLLALSKQTGFKLERIDALLVDEVDVSSTKIRNALQQSDVAKANHYLGYTFSLKGTVTKGNQIGRKIGFPTANIEASDPNKLIPAKGVYAITVDVEGQIYPAMLNIGYRPTVNSNADNRTIEAHILGFDADIYQKEITLFFHEHVRTEQRFNSIDELKLQLETDKKKISEILRAYC
ncbi:MAG: bifunctional riboflavin kinase/FAD synthetase [Prolixibacteraceae bacterium]|nr:bifunctional riboflavin kinase/FAD synthetase [Prolixibacteraceae bacterium]